MLSTGYSPQDRVHGPIQLDGLSSACVEPCQEFLCALPLFGLWITLNDSQDRVPCPAIAGFSHLKRHCVTSLVM